MRIDSDGKPYSFAVGPGSIIFVPAREHHAFYDITERLAVLVFFGPNTDGWDARQVTSPR